MTGFVESGERSKQHAMRQADKIPHAMAQRTNHGDAWWFSLMVAGKQEGVAGGRFCRIMDLYL
ncbi:hypothetical protein [Paraburkholderia sp. C35]|uniref:hypothetical protein n=1 Tax=Paraburkholderia sp. C35 TaxID=2126993 RepID=UPI0013A59E1E|nr:hypothetical protein [Paraburkholderia sp. C35]